MNWGIAMAENESDDALLEAHFAAARRTGAEMPDRLAARMLADAAREQRARAAPAPAAPGWFGQVLRALGGWPALGGLAAACAAGVWLGIAPPEFLPDPVGLVVQAETDLNLLDSYALSSALPEDG